MIKTINKTILVSSFLALSLNAQTLDELKVQAFNSYKKNDFETAYTQLSKLYMSVLGDAKVNFLLGRAAFETQRYEIALAAFERVQLLEPLNTRNDLELGRTQFKLEMYEDAKLSFEKVLKNPNLPKTVRTNIEIFLTKVNEQLKKSFYTINTKLGFIYDSNVNYAPLNNLNSDNLPSQKGSSAEEFQTTFMHMYDIADKNGLQLRNQISFYHRENNKEELKDYNITYMSYVPALIYQRLYTIYELNLILDRVWLDGIEYLDGISLMPSFTQKLDASNRINGSFKIMDKTYKRIGEEDKDAKNYELALAYQKFYSNAYLNIKTIFTKEIKDSGDRIDVDYKSYALNTTYSNQFYPTYVATVDFNLKRKNYEDFSTYFSNTRVDKSYQLGLNISKKFTSSLYLDGKISYEKNSSNQDIYTYDKTVFGLFLNVSF